MTVTTEQKNEQTTVTPQQSNQPLTIENAEAYHRILVALDHSDDAPAIFSRALALAKANNGRIMLFNCLPDPIPVVAETTNGLMGVGLYGLDASTSIAMAEQRLKKAAMEIQTWLEGFSEIAAQQGVSAEFDHRCGEPGPCICKLAHSWNADLIVVGRRGRRGLTEAFLGSVSNYVLHHASCSVLTVQGPH